jgi:hypothetical protein
MMLGSSGTASMSSTRPPNDAGPICRHAESGQLCRWSGVESADIDATGLFPGFCAPEVTGVPANSTSVVTVVASDERGRVIGGVIFGSMYDQVRWTDDCAL